MMKTLLSQHLEKTCGKKIQIRKGITKTLQTLSLKDVKQICVRLYTQLLKTVPIMRTHQFVTSYTTTLSS